MIDYPIKKLGEVVILNQKKIEIKDLVFSWQKHSNILENMRMLQTKQKVWTACA